MLRHEFSRNRCQADRPRRRCSRAPATLSCISCTRACLLVYFEMGDLKIFVYDFNHFFCCVYFECVDDGVETLNCIRFTWEIQLCCFCEMLRCGLIEMDRNVKNIKMKVFGERWRFNVIQLHLFFFSQFYSVGCCAWSIINILLHISVIMSLFNFCVDRECRNVRKLSRKYFRMFCLEI